MVWVAFRHRAACRLERRGDARRASRPRVPTCPRLRSYLPWRSPTRRSPSGRCTSPPARRRRPWHRSSPAVSRSFSPPQAGRCSATESRVRSGAGLTVAMVGVVVVATASSGITSSGGIGLALLAAAAPALGTVLMRRLAPTIDLLVTTGAQFLLGGAILLAVSAVFEPWAEISWSPATVAGLLVLGVIGTGFAYVAWFWLLGRTLLRPAWCRAVPDSCGGHHRRDRHRGSPWAG